MTQSINKSILCIAVHVPISFHSQASSILKYDGLNFFECKTREIPISGIRAKS